MDDVTHGDEPYLPATTELRPRRRRAGPVELAVRADVKAVKAAKVPGRATLGALATVLARAIDDGGAPSTVAKLVQELRAVMMALRGGSDDDGGDPEFTADMSTPVRDAPVA